VRIVFPAYLLKILDETLATLIDKQPLLAWRISVKAVSPGLLTGAGL